MKFKTSYTPPPPTDDLRPEIRIFISSTFRDMQDEREYLIKYIFPELRTLCRERGVEFTEIDLRWGVTEEEAQQGKVVKICLDEIDKCRPYFIGLLGERYGWVPSHEDIVKDTALNEEYPWIISAVDDGISVTEMEMVYGVLDNPEFAKHAYFYTRSNTITKQEFKDTSEIAINKQNFLKERIRSSGFPVRENYESIQLLGDMVRNDLLKVIEEDFPLADAPTPLEQERSVHEAYSFTRRKAYIPRTENISTLDSYVSPETQPLIITGESGSGKSSLVSYWAHDYKKRHPDAFIVSHFVGAGSSGSGHVSIIQRVMEEIKDRYTLDDTLPTTQDAIEGEFQNWLAKIQQEQMIILVDGLDRLPDQSRHLRWLPNHFPPNVSAFFSVDKSQTLGVLQEKGFATLEVLLLDESERDSLIVEYLGQYRKALSYEQRLTLIQEPKTANPLFLRTILEELRIFGSFEELSDRISHYISSDNTSDLFQRVLERMEHDYGRSSIENILSLIWASRDGLSETELLEISELSRLELSRLLHTLEYQLMRRDGLLDFYHQFLRTAVDKRYLSSNDSRDNEKKQHLRIAEYFDTQGISNRKASELPWQLQLVEDKQRLKDCLGVIPMFIEFSHAEKYYELLAYWRYVGDLHIMEEEYQSNIHIYFNDTTHKNRELETYESFGRYFHECGRFNTAENFYRQLLLLTNNVNGETHLHTAEILYRFAMLLKDKGSYSEAIELYHKSFKIRESNLGRNHIAVAQCLFHLGRVQQELGDYQKAESLVKQSLAIGINSVGEVHQEVAKIMNNLAILYREQGNFGEAEFLFRRSIEIGEKLSGKDDHLTVQRMMNLAQLLHVTKQMDEAKSLFEQVLSSFETIFGREHPRTAEAIDNLAILLRDIGDYTKALELYRETLTIWEKLVGEKHIYTATTLNNLGEVLMDLDCFEESEECYSRSRNIFENLIGKEHPYTSHPIHGMGLVNRKKGDFIHAAEYFRQAYEIREKAFGAHHETLEALNDYISVVEKLDQPHILTHLNSRRKEIEKKSISES